MLGGAGCPGVTAANHVEVGNDNVRGGVIPLNHKMAALSVKAELSSPIIATTNFVHVMEAGLHGVFGVYVR